jgi:hypothetical protein
MSTEVKVRGALQLTEPELDELLEALDDEDDEVADAIREQFARDGGWLRFNVDVQLSNTGNLAFQEWLDDVAEAAIAGFVDTWQESFGDSTYVRLSAGGDEQEIDGRFPTEG